MLGPRLRASAAAAAILLLTIGAGQSFASAPDVECGQLAAYTAPDPAGPTDGSLTLGLSSTWDVLATATISPAAAADLPSGGNSGPTCLALGLDGSGKVTSIDFAPQGTLSGTVAYDSGSAYFIFASRLLIPKTITDAYPALGALFDSSYQAGATLAITFSIDTTTGGFTGFDGHTTFCGKASISAANVGKVTSIDFAPQGTLSGTVAYDSGSAYFIFASRLLIPKTITDAYPALGALFDSSYQAGATLAITFSIDTTTGGFTGFDGHTTFCGKASISAANVGKVGKATIPAGALNAAARAKFHKLSGQAVCAKVHSTGTIDPLSGNIATSAAVALSTDPSGPRATPPATTTNEAVSAPSSASSPIMVWLVLAFGLTLAVAGALGRRSRKR